jgi:hypothetical protein
LLPGHHEEKSLFLYTLLSTMILCVASGPTVMEPAFEGSKPQKFVSQSKFFLL